MALMSGWLCLKDSLMLWPPSSALSIASLRICWTYVLLSIWMISSFILKILQPIKNTSEKFSYDSRSIISMLNWKNVNSIPLLWNISDMSFPQMVLLCHLRRSKPSLIGRNHGKSKMYNPFSDSQISIVVLSSTTWIL